MDSLQLINDFAKRSFRDVADQDYISARMSYKAQLREPFLWSSLQTFEKYFKAILLFNRTSSKGVGHNLLAALERIENIKDISFSIPNDTRDFIKYINKYGTNRYLEHHSHLRHGALQDLDRSVWHIRSYCYYMRSEFKTSKGKTVKQLPLNIQKINTAHNDKKWHKYKINDGLLEKIIKQQKEAYNALIWHNFYYGKRKRRIIKNYKHHVSSINTTLTMYPEIFKELSHLVTFSKETCNHYKNNIKQ